MQQLMGEGETAESPFSGRLLLRNRADCVSHLVCHVPVTVGSDAVHQERPIEIAVPGKLVPRQRAKDNDAAILGTELRVERASQLLIGTRGMNGSLMNGRPLAPEVVFQTEQGLQRPAGGVGCHSLLILFRRLRPVHGSCVTFILRYDC